MNETVVFIAILTVFGIVCSYCKKENDKMNEDTKKTNEALQSFIAASKDKNIDKIMRDHYK